MIPVPLPLELRPDPGTAQDWVRAELAERPYQPTLLQRITDWFWDLLQRIGDAAQGVGRLSPLVALGLLVLLLAGLALVLARLRREPRSGNERQALLEDAHATAREYRDQAARARAEERWDDVVVHGMRALALGLVERSLVDDLPAITAREVADAAARVFPAYQPRLAAAARLFDDVRYGDRHASRERAEDLLALEDTLRHERPASLSAPAAELVVPR